VVPLKASRYSHNAVAVGRPRKQYLHIAVVVGDPFKDRVAYLYMAVALGRQSTQGRVLNYDVVCLWRQSTELWCGSENIIWGNNNFFTKNEEYLRAKYLDGGPWGGARDTSLYITLTMILFCFTSPQPVRPKDASDSVSTIRVVMPLTVELTVRFSLRTQCKRCPTDAYAYENMKPIEHILLHPIIPICILSRMMCICKHCNIKLPLYCWIHWSCWWI